jgi:hypothetical protein
LRIAETPMLGERPAALKSPGLGSRNGVSHDLFKDVIGVIEKSQLAA